MDNTVNVALYARPNLNPLDATRKASSACGVCGKVNLHALEARGMQCISSDLRLEVGVLYDLRRFSRSPQRRRGERSECF